MKLIVHTPINGDWTVVVLDGKQIYSGGDSWNHMIHSIVHYVSNVSVEFKEWDDEEFHETFM